MTLATFLLIKAIISLAFGIPFVLAPAALMSLYGITLDPVGTLMSRYFGATLIGIGLVCLLTRRATDPKALQGITLALFIGDTVGFIVGLLGQFEPTASPLGWVNVAIWLLLALGLGYFRFLKPSVS